jgi:hypothetical protein
MRRGILIVLAAIGCDGGNGGGDSVPGTTPIVDLDAAETDLVCDDFVDATGPERTADCGGGQMVTVGGESKQECIDNINATPPACAATVDDLLACFADIAALSDDDLCADVVPESCEILFGTACQV